MQVDKKIDSVYDINAETGVLCTLIHNPDFILHSETLTPSYFYKKENGSIYWAIQQLYQKGIDRIDEFNLTTQINSNIGVKNIVESHNQNFIRDLVEDSEFVSRNSKEEYQEIVNTVVTLSFKRDVYKKLKHFENQCLDENTDLNQLNLSIMDDIDKLASQYVTQDNIPMYNENIYNIWDNIVEKRNDDGSFGIPSKHKILEKYFTYQSGELILLAARRKHGKSIYGMNEMVYMLKQGVSCVYLDTEMNDESFTTRLLSHLTGIEEYRVKAGRHSKEEAQQIDDALEWINNQNFTHIYDPEWTRDKVYTTCKILKNKIDFDLLIYDYIKITDNSLTSSSEQYNELGNWCNFLKNNVAGSLDIPVMSFVQLNRQLNIADSDKIERYASTGLKWIKKTPEEIAKDGVECGNYKMNIMFNRLGGDMDEDEYIDFVFNDQNLGIDVCKTQHKKDVPSFMGE